MFWMFWMHTLSRAQYKLICSLIDASKITKATLFYLSNILLTFFSMAAKKCPTFYFTNNDA